MSDSLPTSTPADCPCGDTGRPGHPVGWCDRFAVDPLCSGRSARVTSIEGPFADALRAEGAAAERERIRLELLAEAKADFETSVSQRGLGGCSRYEARSEALRDFARRLEVK